MALFIVPPPCGCGWRIRATGARGRGPGLKRPSRRPSGPGKMTSGMAPAEKWRGRLWSAGRWRYIGTARFRAIGTDLPERIYLDHAATTPILPAAKAAVVEAMERWANPSSPHAEGRAAHAALEDARARIKASLGWQGDLIFTSGASEGLAIALGRTDRRVIASAVEHDAVFRAAPDAQVLPIGAKAEVSRDALDEALRSGPPALVAIQHINSETGVKQPIEALAAQVRESGGLLVCDCSQSAGKIPLPDADMIVVSAHKLGGPPGIGALLVREAGTLKAVGGQEFGYRPGTQNLPGALGFAVALEQFEIGVFSGGIPGALPMARWLSDIGHSVQDLEYSI